jgi:hypothetical protein
MNKDKKWLPISLGTLVETTRANLALRDGVGQWTQEARESRRWGVRGEVIRYHDSHGLCYEVRHEDGTVGHYDPFELKVVT